MTSCTLDWE